jgi:hypothetical protein
VKRLRHPIRAIREPFGTAGLIIAVVALVAALGGSAIAASGALTGKQKKEVEKIAKKFAGKPGTNGTNGSNGSPGAAGKDGAAGTNGTNGTNGTGVTTSSFTGSKTVGSVHCEEGGVAVKSVSPETAVCNGTNGSSGGTLPPGQTETGTWSAFVEEQLGSGTGPISFPVPLELGLDGGHVVYLNHEETAKGGSERTREVEVSAGVKKQVGELCAGAAATPEAAPGFLCVYTVESFGEEPVPSPYGPIINPAKAIGGVVSAEGASTSGALVFLTPPAGNAAMVYGIWAVTAP